MKCHVTDPIYGTNAVAEFEGKLTDDSHRLTQKVIDLLDLQMKLDDERLDTDQLLNGARTLIWVSRIDRDPIIFEFTE